MKTLFKSILLLAGVTLLLAGCAKKGIDANEGGLQKVTFSAVMANDVTRAVADNDGNAAYVNRCIMEIYYGDELFTKLYAPVKDKKASFTLDLVSNRTYTVAFWADSVATPSGEGLATDLYYNTSSLKAISIKDTYVGNNDGRDAFFHSGEYLVPQGGAAFDVTLKRPFAQVNVITTDLQTIKPVPALKPTGVAVTVKQAYTKFNAVTGEVSEPQDLDYTATLYNFPETIGDKTDATLSMDYLFAATTKEVIDIDWKATKTGDTDVAHAFSNIPYQRNYRTNIKGKLLTATGQWNVTIDPIWEGDDIPYEVVNDILSANDVIKKGVAQGKPELNIKFANQPDDAGIPGQTKAITSRAILTTPLPSTTTLNIIVEAETEDIYIGDYVNETSTEIATSGLNATVVNINVPTGGSIKKLVINAPSKTVYINGIKAESTGIITNIDAITSDNTLVIEKNQNVTILTVRQGGLEIHGNVTTATIPNDHGAIYVRDCENLDEDNVYNVLKNHIAEGYLGVKGRTTEGKWDIAPIICKIGDTYYCSVNEAVKAIQAVDAKNGASLPAATEITLVADCKDGFDIGSEDATAAKNIRLNLAGFSLTTGSAVGSVGTVTNGIRVLAHSKLEIVGGNLKFGELETDNIKVGIANYGTLTLNNVKATSGPLVTYPINNRGELNLNGLTSISDGTIAPNDYSEFSGKIFAITMDPYDAVYQGNRKDAVLNVSNNTVSVGNIQIEKYHSNGGKIYTNISNGYFGEICLTNSYSVTAVSKSITGGSFTSKPDDSLIANGHIATEQQDGRWVVSSGGQIFVARILRNGEYLYSSGSHVGISGAFAYVLDYGDPCVQTGDKVELLADFSEGSSTAQIAMEKSWTLDLCGHSLTDAGSSDSFSWSSGSQSSVLWAQAQVNSNTNRIIFQDSSDGQTGKIENNATDVKKFCSAISINAQSGATELVFKGGTYKSGLDAIYMEKGLVTIDGGTFIGQNAIRANAYGNSYLGFKCNLVINGGVFNGDINLATQVAIPTSDNQKCNAVINGGTVNGDLIVGKNVGLTISGGKFHTSKATKYLVDGKYLYEDQSYFTVVDNKPATYVASINGNTFYTTDSNKAIQDATSGDVIQLKANTTYVRTLQEGEEITILADVAIEYADPVAAEGFTIKVTDVEGGKKYSVPEIKPCYIGTTGYNSLDEGLAALQGGQTLILEKDIVVTNTVSVPSGKHNACLDLNGHKITESFTSNKVLLQVHWSSKLFNIKDSKGGGLIKNTRGSAIQKGTSSGAKGQLYIHGGTFEGSTYGLDVTTGICVINGGTFKGGSAAINRGWSVNDTYYFQVNGGTFNYDVSKISGTGFSITKSVVDNGDGTWTVK